MDKIARLSRDERSEIIQETARRIDLTPSAVEKDFWVVWTLDKLFQSPLLADKIIFKGGTSLSKVFGLIRRFSEVAEFKARFYPASWANYELAKPGTFKLMPAEKNRRFLAHDYEQMKVMFFGEIPPFNELLKSLQMLEDEINSLEPLS